MMYLNIGLEHKGLLSQYFSLLNAIIQYCLESENNLERSLYSYLVYNFSHISSFRA